MFISRLGLEVLVFLSGMAFDAPMWMLRHGLDGGDRAHTVGSTATFMRNGFRAAYIPKIRSGPSFSFTGCKRLVLLMPNNEYSQARDERKRGPAAKPVTHLAWWKRGNVAGDATFMSEVRTIIRGGLFLIECLKEWSIGLPRAKFTIWGMMEAVAAVAILLSAISFPPAAPAIFGFSGAVVVHLVVPRTEQFEAACPAFGFAIGAAIGIFFYLWRLSRGMGGEIRGGRHHRSCDRHHSDCARTSSRQAETVAKASPG